MYNHYAIPHFTAAALRARAKDNSELLSQVLFGEPLRILEQGRQWTLVQCAEDGFEGYVKSNQISPVDELTFLQQKNNPAFALDVFTPILGEQFGMPITLGSRLPGFDGLHLHLNGKRFSYSGQAVMSQDIQSEADLMIKLARRLLFSPQLSGGRTPTGIDSAALVQLVARVIHLQLPRTAETQVQYGRTVDFVIQCQPGDLAFFEDPRGNIDHVGILLPESRILHVYDRVRIDAIDHFGIYNYELQKYTHRLRIVKRLLADTDTPIILQEKRERQPKDERQIVLF